MLKMSLLTLVGLYAILAVAGREAPGPAPGAVPEAASAQIESPAPVAAVTPAALIETPDAASPAALIVAQPAAVRLPGPALRPAPEYRRPEPLAAAPGAAAAAAPVEEQTEFTVVLASAGDKKIEVIKEVRAITGLGL